MNQSHYTPNQRQFKQLNLKSRIELAILLKSNLSKVEIAKKLNVDRSTVYREISRGSIDLLTTNYETVRVYESQPAQNLSDKRNLASRKKPKYLTNPKILEEIQAYIKKHKFSFEIISGRMKYENSPFCLSHTTLYNYYHKKILAIPERFMPSYHYKNHESKRTRRENIEHKRINNRPEEINQRIEPMHWEKDLIIGTQKKGAVILSMVERKYRLSLLFKLSGKQSQQVIKVIDDLHEKTGEKFPIYFKSFTSDNGSEFQNYKEVERNGRTILYYAHPYSSWKRGTNENLNREVRRFFPKKTNFNNITTKQIRKVQDWMNNKPRKVLGYKTPIECLKELFPEFLEMNIV